MTGRNRTILILAVVLAVLAGLGYYLTSTPVSPPAATPEPTVVVWDYSAATVQGLMAQSMTQTVALQNVNGNWQITAPKTANADNVQVSQEADQLKAPAARSKIGDNVTDSDLVQYGLASPALTVTLTFSGTATPQRLLVGKPNLDGSAYYVRPAGSHTVTLVANTVIEPLKTWLGTPPIAQPTPTPLAPVASPITGTGTLTGTAPITSTGPLSGTVPLGGTPALTPALAGTAVITGTEPAPGASAVSTPPATGAGASPAPAGAGGGPGGSTPVLLTPTP